MKWDSGMDIYFEDETSYTIPYKEAFLEYLENEYFADQQCVLDNIPENVLPSNLVPSTMASGLGQSSFDPYDLFSDDEKYLMPNNLAEITHG